MLVEAFLTDNVQQHGPELKLINPHHDSRLAAKFASKRTLLDYLHNPTRDFTVQFVGSHWWHSEGLYRELDRPFYDGPTCAFDARLERLGLKERYQFSNCAMGYIPISNTANRPFTQRQIKYLHSKKLEEYRVMGTKCVFALGQTVLTFHLFGTGIRFDKFSSAINNGKITLSCGLDVVPMPHPGALGVMNYLRERQGTLHQRAQDVAFMRLIEHAGVIS